MRFLATFRPKLGRNGGVAVPVGYGTSHSGCPVRRYRDPRTGRMLVFGLDRDAWMRGIVKPRQLG